MVERIVAQLTADGLSEHALGKLDSDAVMIAKTADRSVLGSMNDLALTCRLATRDAGGLADLDLEALPLCGSIPIVPWRWSG